MKDKAYVTEPIHEAALDVLKRHMDVIMGDGQPRTKVRDLIGDCAFILSKTDPVVIDREIIDAAPRLRHIARHGSGYSNVDVAYASQKGVSVSYVSGVNAVAIAEYTMGLMLLASRKLLVAVEETRKGAPERSQFLGVELFGKTLGIIGLGTIGREVVKRAAAFGMKVLVYHPRRRAGISLALNWSPRKNCLPEAMSSRSMCRSRGRRETLLPATTSGA
jgi:D-3-phosphoglycerate dehydrogenase